MTSISYERAAVLGRILFSLFEAPNDVPSTGPSLGDVFALQQTLLERIDQMSGSVDNSAAEVELLRTNVTRLTTVVGSATTLMSGFAGLLAGIEAKQAQTGANDTLLQPLRDLRTQLETQIDSLGAAVAANTPADTVSGGATGASAPAADTVTGGAAASPPAPVAGQDPVPAQPPVSGA